MFFPLKENPWYYADTSISVQEPNMTIFILFFSEEPELDKLAPSHWKKKANTVLQLAIQILLS